MFQKVRLRLAALCAGITGFILLTMSCAWLYISERSLHKNSFVSFQSDMNTIIANMEQQTVITHEWLNKLENHGKYRINIIDNGVPFLYNERNNQEQKELFSAAWEAYESRFQAESKESTYADWHEEFPFSYGGIDYYVCAAISERKNGTFQVMILFSLATLGHQIWLQRFLFLGLDAFAIALLSLFSWYFTNQLLYPLEENQKNQVQFIASASHELRTPLAVILSCASAAQKAQDAEREHFLSSIREEGTRMSLLIDELLLLTSTGSRRAMEKEPVELDTLLLNLYESFEPLAKDQGLSLRIELPEEALPPCTCDSVGVGQALSILMNNAFCYTPTGGHVALVLTYSAREEAFRISVIDDGIGIADSEKARIFERFYRTDPSRSQKEHFGLGLSIALEIINSHHGRILVDDTLGGGSTFTVVLPSKIKD